MTRSLFDFSFALSAEECKKKWKTLRIQQRRLLIKKIRKKGKFNGAQWNCYEPLKFLIPHMDWTTAEENTVIKETHGLLGDTDQEDDDEAMGDCGMSNDDPAEGTDTAETELKLEPTVENAAVEAPTITEQIVYSTQPVSYQATAVANTPPKSQSLSQYVLTYVPTQPRGGQEETLVDASAATSACRTAYGKPIDESAQTLALTSAMPSYQVVSSIDQMLHRSSSVPVKDGASAAGSSLSSDLNYFLLDVAQVMNKLNDIAQMELKIEINKLLLTKLRDGRNLHSA